MTDVSHSPERPAANHTYSKRDLTYANTFDNKVQEHLIRFMEMLTGKLKIFQMIRRFERLGAPTGIDFWSGALKAMRIDILTPEEQFANIPKTGPVVVVANHTHGLVDGMIMAELIARVRPDFQILTRSVLTGLDEVASSFLIPVPFPHDPEAQEKGVEMRKQAMERLKSGGVIAVFPSGVVAASETWFGKPVEKEWNLFTAQLIRRSGAEVVPIHFHGHNTRAYNIANKVSATLRQGLLIHEIVRACNMPHSPTIGAPLSDEQKERLTSDPRGFIAWLREHTLSLSH
ncbi:lysophospholipid acyltransferase family protein [Maritimibacter sp. DP1N21-5]|uniref:lysophospholipid acyltransferase family protein n=1 Tax=Maritimibacter sp. DP1N21-5 TaxID=2836867 RepID=UPI001C437DFB|nr:lysophospholipid acyltransferase family protein [Maritimibacter sp. DP1N21-5]MBV7407934.1 lysophospholipid acyltransferase family protein [Maritimibacter sp. DP1N21-5]